MEKTLLILTPLVAMVTLSVGVPLGLPVGFPEYNLPNEWSPEAYLEYLMQEQAAINLRPSENRLFDTDNQEIGMISGIDVNSSGILHVFHRADRQWDADTFSEDNVLSDKLKEPIEKATILALDPVTGTILNRFGEAMFNLPHGLKFDDKDNLWLTDVGMHQVFRIPKGSNKPDLTIGEAFVPGSSDDHFCKPTDVVVASNGQFFVADGYCNRRIMKFDKDGKFLSKIGVSTSEQGFPMGPEPFEFNTPHSLTLVEELDLVCVADRDNLRAMCFNAGMGKDKLAGHFNRTLIPENEIGQVYSIYYNKADKTVVAAGELNDVPVRYEDSVYYPARAYTYGLNGQERAEWAYITPEIARKGPSLIHAVCTSKDGNDYFLADILQRKVYKYSKVNDPKMAE